MATNLLCNPATVASENVRPCTESEKDLKKLDEERKRLALVLLAITTRGLTQVLILVSL